MYGITSFIYYKKRCATHRNFKPTNVSSGRIAGKPVCFLPFYFLKVHFLIYHLAIQNLEGIQFRFSIK